MKQPKKTDRRVQRTQELLRNSLIALILEKRYDKITVQDIIDRANVGRSTFYAHYQDKEDLLVSGFDMLSDSLDQHMETDHTHSPHLLHSLAFFKHAAGHHDLYKAMREGGGGDLLLATTQHHVQEQIAAHLRTLSANENSLNIPLPAISSYLAGAMLSLMLWWLDNELPCSPEEINEIFQQMAGPTVTAVLRFEGV